jgi:hypothetical protein
MSQAEGAMRWSGAYAAASMLVVQLVSSVVVESKYCVLGPHIVFLFGCAAVLLSPAQRAVVELSQRPAEIAWEVFGACSSASSLAGARGTETSVRRTGALVALPAASVLVVQLVSSVVVETKYCVLGPHIAFLFGCAAVLLSPAQRAVVELSRRAAETARKVFDACSSASSPAGSRGTEAAVRRTGALVALAAASVLVQLVLFPSIEKIKHAMLFVYTIFLLGSAAVLLSPAYRSVEEFVRRDIHVSSSRANTVSRWAGFACISFCAAADGAANKSNGMLLFLPFLVGVWAVSLSMPPSRDPTPFPMWQCLPTPPPAAAEEAGHDDGVVKVHGTAHDVVASEVWNTLHLDACSVFLTYLDFLDSDPYYSICFS